jgi:hypothetical protein
MDSLFLTSRPRVKPMKDSSEVDEIFRIDRSCEVMLRAMTATVPCRVFRANRVCHAHFSYFDVSETGPTSGSRSSSGCEPIRIGFEDLRSRVGGLHFGPVW